VTEEHRDRNAVAYDCTHAWSNKNDKTIHHYMYVTLLEQFRYSLYRTSQADVAASGIITDAEMAVTWSNCVRSTVLCIVFIANK